MPEANPYQSSDLRNEKDAPAFRLRMIPAVLLGVIGVASLAWGFLALIVVTAIALRDYDESASVSEQTSPIGLMLIATMIFLGVGCATMISAWHIWKQKYRHAVAYFGGVVVLVACAVTMSTIWGRN